LWDHRLDLGLLVDELFANRISSFFAWDLLISATVFVVFLLMDGGRLPRGQRGLVIATTALIGLSFGLPLYLLFRERSTAVTVPGRAARYHPERERY
jgi:hypothetical protein